MTDLSYTIVWSAAAGVAAGILVWEVLRAWPLLERLNRSERKSIADAELAEKSAAEARKRVEWALEQARAAKAAHDASQAGKRAYEAKLSTLRESNEQLEMSLAAMQAQMRAVCRLNDNLNVSLESERAEFVALQQRYKAMTVRQRGEHGRFKSTKPPKPQLEPVNAGTTFSIYAEADHGDK